MQFNSAQKNKILLPVMLGLAHGVSDGSAGMLLGNIGSTASVYTTGSYVMVYNLLAFGMQPLAGILADKLKAPKLAATGGLLLMAAALFTVNFSPLASVIMAGIASAAFHTGGGAIAIYSTPGKSAGTGFFSAPGVAGLAIGAYLAFNQLFLPVPFIAALAVLAGLTMILELPLLPYNIKESEVEFDSHDFIMFAMLFAIALRSAIWNVFQYIEEANTMHLLGIGFAAAGGKIVGGYFADKIGWRNWSLAAITLAIPLLVLGKDSYYLLLPGIALMQSVTPVFVCAVASKIPRFPATASGLTFGLAIAAGGIPFKIGMDVNQFGSPLLIAVALAGIVLITWFVLRKRSAISGA
jgi:FSR family fosmidomycin resistance protein-like MFS transporter